MESQYYTIEAPSEGIHKEKGSKFYSFAYPISNLKAVGEHLQHLETKHARARHYCYAYRLGTKGLQFRTVDDGEPSGTAGKPILGQIDSAGVTDILIVVVRYFGGTLLGASGLARAYRESAKDALSKAKIISIEIKRSWLIEFDLSIMGQLFHAISGLPVKVQQKDLDISPKLIITTPWKDSDLLLDKLLARTLKIHQEIIAGRRVFNGIKITEIFSDWGK